MMDTLATFAALPAVVVALLVGYYVFGARTLPHLLAMLQDVPRRWRERTFVHCYRVA